MIYVGNHLQKLSCFKYVISTSSQCITKQVVHKGSNGENLQFVPSCWILKVQYFKGSFELNLKIWLQFIPPPWDYLDKNASTSVFFYPDLEYFWYDFILPEVQVVNELHQKKSPELQHWPTRLHVTKLVLPMIIFDILLWELQGMQQQEVQIPPCFSLRGPI